MTGAGDLKDRVRFESQGTESDGAGGTRTAWTAQFTVWAEYKHLRGGENVMAARLAGTHPAVIRVRASSQSRAAARDWRIVDARNGTVFNIRDISPTAEGAWLDFLCESGVAS